MAVLYDLPTIGNKDWYRWGAEMLVANQKAQGNWENGGYHGNNPIIDTCLALLFLKRVNLVADLTTRLPFDPNTLTSSIQAQVRPPAPEPHSSPTNQDKNSTPKTSGTVPLQSSERETLPAAKASVKPAPVPARQVELGTASEETETPAEGEWLWLLVTIAIILFVASGILLTSYSLARARSDKRPRRLHHAKSVRRIVP